MSTCQCQRRSQAQSHVPCLARKPLNWLAQPVFALSAQAACDFQATSSPSAPSTPPGGLSNCFCFIHNKYLGSSKIFCGPTSSPSSPSTSPGATPFSFAIAAAAGTSDPKTFDMLSKCQIACHSIRCPGCTSGAKILCAADRSCLSVSQTFARLRIAGYTARMLCIAAGGCRHTASGRISCASTTGGRCCRGCCRRTILHRRCRRREDIAEDPMHHLGQLLPRMLPPATHPQQRCRRHEETPITSSCRTKQSLVISDVTAARTFGLLHEGSLGESLSFKTRQVHGMQRNRARTVAV